MSLDKLIEMCPPPAKPIDSAIEGRVEEVRSRHGLVFPRDYIRFGTIYGTGCFVGENTHLISINNPLSRYYFDNVKRETLAIAAFFEESISQEWLSDHHIDPSCLFPLGHDSDDAYLVWVVTPDPERWKVMLFHYTIDLVELFDCGISSFLVQYFSSQLAVKGWQHRAANGRAPRYRFEPAGWVPGP